MKNKNYQKCSEECVDNLVLQLKTGHFLLKRCHHKQLPSQQAVIPTPTGTQRTRTEENYNKKKDFLLLQLLQQMFTDILSNSIYFCLPV